MDSSLRKDIQIIGDANKLQKDGIMLTSLSNSKEGRVVFSLQEIPMRVNFSTPNNNRLQRVSDNRVFIATPDGQHKHKIELSTKINYSNKDQYLWAQSQSDLCILNNPKLLSTGINLREQVSGNTLKIFSLKDLPLGTKYFTENDNILQRKSVNEVVIADKILLIDPNQQKFLPPTKWDADKSRKLKSDVSAILYDGNTPEGDQEENEIAEGVVSSVAALLMDSPDFPKITSCSIIGTRHHGSPLELQYTYSGGIEGSSSIRWERKLINEINFIPIKGATGKFYTTNINDIGSLIRVAYTPVRADGVTGMIVFSKACKIRISPDIKAEIESNLALNTIMFKVLLRNGNEFQKRSILLNRTKVKVRKRRSTITKAKYCPYLQATPLADDCMFTLKFSNSNEHMFMTPSMYQRDIIVLTIRAFNAGC